MERTQKFPAGHQRTEICAPAHCGNQKLDLAATLQFYLSHTEAKRQLHLELAGSRPGRLFVANTRPHQAVTPSTLARYSTSLLMFIHHMMSLRGDYYTTATQVAFNRNGESRNRRRYIQGTLHQGCLQLFYEEKWNVAGTDPS